MEEAYVVDDKAVKLISEEEYTYAYNIYFKEDLQNLSLENCINIQSQLLVSLNTISDILNTFPYCQYIKYSFSDYLYGYNLESRYSSLLRYLQYDIKDIDNTVRLCEMMSKTNLIFGSYRKITKLLFKLQRDNCLEQYIYDDAEYLVSHIRNKIGVDSLSDIKLDKNKFKSLFDRHFTNSHNISIDNRLDMSPKKFMKALRKFEKYTCINEVPVDFLKECLSYLVKYFISNNICDSFILDLFSCYYWF